MSLTDKEDDFCSQSKWNQLRRLEFIDFRLGCDGKVNRKDLVDFFNISIPQASLDLSKYNEIVSQATPQRKNLSYDRHLKVYVKSADYKPIFPKICSPENYLNDLLSLAQGDLVKSRNFFGFVPNVGVASFNPPRRNISSQVLYNILEAIRTKKALRIAYYSLTSLKQTDNLIAPHGLAFDGMRWHVRAYCYEKHSFRDYVLSRIVKCAEPSIIAPNDRYAAKVDGDFIEVGTSGRDDREWNDLVDLVLKPNPDLPDAARRAIEFDYGMGDKGYVIYPCRRALLFYALQYLRLTEADKALPAMSRLIVLDNEAEVMRRLNGGN